jgi:hypothetical protein
MQLAHITGAVHAPLTVTYNIQVVCLYNMLNINGVLKDLLKKGDTNLIKTNLL